MTLRAGENGRYRYYACSIRARQGEAGCKGRAIPMYKLDRIVVSHIGERLLDPERIEDVLASLLDRRQEGVERRSQHVAELNHRAAEADNRLYDAIEAGSLDPAESSLGERIAGLTALRDQARADATRIEAMLASSTHQRLAGPLCGNWRAKCAPDFVLERVAIAGNMSGPSPSTSRSRMTGSTSKAEKTSY